MLSLALRFSAMLVMIMLSFALAFHAAFHTCVNNTSSTGLCSIYGNIDDGSGSSVRDAFGSFSDSFVTVFASALGGPDFSSFDDLPDVARAAGTFLMVVSSGACTLEFTNEMLMRPINVNCRELEY